MVSITGIVSCVKAIPLFATQTLWICFFCSEMAEERISIRLLICVVKPFRIFYINCAS